jgi:hypothetical protein
MNLLKEVTMKFAVVGLCFGLAFPNIALAQKGKNIERKSVKPGKLIKGERVVPGKKGIDKRTLGRQFVQAMITGTGPMAKKLGLKSKIDRKSLLRQIRANRKGNVKGLKAKLKKLKLKKGVTKGLSALSMKDNRLRATLNEQLKGKDLNKLVEESFRNIEKFLPTDLYSRFGAAIQKGDRANMAKIMAELKDQIKNGGGILNPEDMKESAAWLYLETAVAVALILVLVLIDFNFQAEEFEKLGDDLMINNVIKNYQIR